MARVQEAVGERKVAMVDPLTTLGPKALEAAAGEVSRRLYRAQEFEVQDVRQCQNYLEAASIAIRGLEEEYDQILVEAEACLTQPEKILDVIVRIETYLTVDVLRVQLNQAIAGLEPIKAALQGRADRVLQWPWSKRDRQKAVADFAMLLEELDGYLSRLEEGLRHRPGGTGVAVKPLREIQERLRKDDKAEVIRLVREAQGDRTKDDLMNYTARIRQTIELLRLQFR